MTTVQREEVSQIVSVPGLTVLVVDDEELSRNDLTWLLERASGVDEVLTAGSTTEAIRLLGARPETSALFLDVQMPGLDGLELARLLKNYKQPPAIAFVTAYEEYAIEAFDLEACDYLLKPVDADRLDETIRRMARSAVDDAGGQTSLATLVCRRGNDTYTISRDEISIVEAAGDLVRVHTDDGGSHLVRESISSLTAAWSSVGYLRIHRSFLVRVSSITKVRTKAGARSVEVDGRELPVSRRYTRLLEDQLGRGT